jgi:hypothetical protein
LRTPRIIWIIGLAIAALAPHATARAEDAPPVIRKPMPAPSVPSYIPPLPPAQYDPTLTIGGQDVEARKVRTRLSVDVEVNGRGPYRFIVDSGADTSVVGLRIAHDLELPLGRPAVLHGMTARNLVDRVKVDELRLGTTTVTDLQLPALREIDLGGEGIVGIDALQQQRLMMDFERQTIKVEDARVVRYKPQPGEIVVIARRERGQLILTHVRARGISLDAVIDTGSEITIGNLALRDKLVRRKGQTLEEIEATGVTGATMKLQVAVIDELELGPILLRNVPMAFADVPPFKMFGLADEPALLIGTDLLDTFRRVSLDFKARKVRFQLRRCKDTGVIATISHTTSLMRLSSTGTGDVCAR